MAEFGLAPGPMQDPVGGFLQGAERGISLINVLRKRHRDIRHLLRCSAAADSTRLCA